MDGLPQGGAADPQLLGQSTSPGSFSPGARRRSTAIMVYSRSAVCWDRHFFLHTDLPFFQKGGDSPLTGLSLSYTIKSDNARVV